MRHCPICRAPHRAATECAFDRTPLAPEEQDALSGTMAGERFLLLERVADAGGAGSDGPVYRAAAGPALVEHEVQVLFAELSAASFERAARLRELAAAASLHGRWLQRVVTFGPLSPAAASGPLFVALEPAPPRSLEGELGHGPLEEPRALRLCRRLAAGVAHAHERGLAHGALDARAVRLLDQDGEVDAPLILGRWRPAVSEGSFAADLRALGALLFHLLSGGPLPPGASGAPSIRESNPSVQVSFAVERLVQRLLDRSPDSRLLTARGVMRALDEVGARAALEVARGNEERPVLPEVPEAACQAMSAGLRRSGAAAVLGQEDGVREPLLAAVAKVAGQAGAEAVAARLLAAGEEVVDLRAALEDGLAAAEHAASADRPGESEREVVLGQFGLAGWLVSRCHGRGQAALSDRFERAFARAIRERLERRDVVPDAVAALAGLEEASLEDVRRGLVAAREALEAPVTAGGQVLDEAAFRRLKREAFGDEENALSRCVRRAEVVAAVEQAIDDASESYACGDVGGAFRVYVRACERLLSEVLSGPGSDEVREHLESALRQSREGVSEEDAAWVMRRALDGLLEMDARVAR